MDFKIFLSCKNLKEILNGGRVVFTFVSPYVSSVIVNVEPLELKMFRDLILINNSKSG